MTMLIVALRNFPNAPKNTTVRTNISSINVQFSPFRFCSVSARRPLQTATAVHYCLQYRPPSVERSNSTSLPSVRNVAPNTYRLNTLLATQFLVGTFVLTKGHFSTAVVTAGIYGKCEHFVQPTAVTCSYERLAAETARNTGSDGPVGCLGWLSLNSSKLTTYLLGTQEAAWRVCEI